MARHSQHSIVKMKHLTTLLLALLLTSATLADDHFTSAETQQISIATPGLFDKGDVFFIDLANIAAKDYSFPLPVGKAKVVGGDMLEITTKKGDAVKAMLHGRVRLARKNKQWGNVVVIRHDNGLETMYAHNAQNLVKAGQTVEAGQTIAIVGTKNGKGRTTFLAMVNGGRINPQTIIDAKSHKLHKATMRFEKSGQRILVRQATEKDLQDKLMADKKAKADSKKAAKEEEKAKREAAKQLKEEQKLLAQEKKAADKTMLKPQKDVRGSIGNRLFLSQFAPSEWCYPLPGSKVISPYGGKRRHSGVDIKTRPNDKILAAFSGIVVRSGPFFGYGNCIVIRHDNGLETLYSHQSRNLVKVGQAVKAGDVIGLTGRTGRATTEHLHFEVSFKGRRIDPALVFNHATKSLHQHTLVHASGVVRVDKGARPPMAQSKSEQQSTNIQ